jgi:hypothetical protein
MKDSSNTSLGCGQPKRLSPDEGVEALGLLAAMLSHVPGRTHPIEELEKTGQARLVMSETLPVDMGREGRKLLEDAGVVFGEPLQGRDRIFLQARLPEGWKKKRTDHAMWSNLVDDKGRRRAQIFFKAAPYHYSAFMHVDETPSDVCKS